MNLFKFLNARNIQLTIEIAQKASKDSSDYSVYKKAELDAANLIADIQCFIYKGIAIPKLLLHFLLVKLHIVSQLSPKELADANKGFIQQAMEAKFKHAQADVATAKAIPPQ